MNEEATDREELLGGQMSFLEHLDEFRKRLVRSIVVVTIAFIFCWFVKEPIYNFLSVPVTRALTQAQRASVPVEGLTGNEKILNLSQLKVGDKGRYVFNKATTLGSSAIEPGTSVLSVIKKDSKGKIGLFTDEPIYIGNAIIPEGIRLPVDFVETAQNDANTDEKLVFTTAVEPFTLYVTVALYGAIVISIPFLLFQIWGFISPALYKHERRYVTPFILLSSISFVLGAAFAYYILFPPAVQYLIGLGSDFTPFLKATDYFDFITLIMLAMGVIFQMPAVAYVLSWIGIISAGFLVRSWKVALVIILIVAAFVSPTGDAPNMMLFATPMMVLYLVSIFIAWFFGKKREADPDDF
ncbi:MAG: twin-arginine translocase subunit TatC [Acidobacteria bacterium]|nr:twin-arginine translocase subunit TatC [Acidobacteriota bacterium]